jgi:hypothetical protein
MDHERFDWLARGLATGASRGSAFAALLGSGLAGAAGLSEAKNRGNAKKRIAKQRKRKPAGRGTAEATAQAADCSRLRSGSNLDGCDFSGTTCPGSTCTARRCGARSATGPTCLGPASAVRR